MQCKKVSHQLSAYILDELTQAERLEMEAHFKECADCARQKETTRNGFDISRSADSIETSAERREKVIHALAVHRQEATLLNEGSGERHFRFLRWLAAAGILLAFGAGVFFWFRSSDRVTLRLEQVRGKVLIQRQGQLSYEVATAGSTLTEGDAVVTEPDGWAQGTLSSAKGHSPCGSLYLQANSTVRVGSRDRQTGNLAFLLERGNIYGELHPLARGQYLFLAPENDRLLIREGAFEVGVKYTIAIMPTPVYVKDKGRYDLAFENETLIRVADAIAQYTGKRLEFTSRELNEKRVNFFAQKDAPERLFRQFVQQMEEQRLAVVAGMQANGDASPTYKIIATVPAQESHLARHLFVRAIQGQGKLVGTHGELALNGGEELAIDSGGYPVRQSVEVAHIALWRKESAPTTLVAQGSIPLPNLDVKVVHRPAEGAATFEYNVENTEFLANIGDKVAQVSIPAKSFNGASEGEVTVPVTIRFVARQK